MYSHRLGDSFPESHVTGTIRCCLAGMLVLYATFAVTPCVIGQQVDERQWRRGYNGFALICRSLGLEPQTSLRTWQSTPENESILVILGSPEGSRISLARYIRKGGALFVASDKQVSILDNEIRFFNSGYQVDPESGFQGFSDCPVVRDISRNHPVTDEISSVVTNRPGVIQVSRSTRYHAIAAFPPLVNSHGRYHFLIASEPLSDERLVCCSDPSVFSNQMIVHGDNARLAMQMLHWLKGSGRTNLLVMVDGKIVVPTDPKAVDVEFPPPSREEVLRAIQNLPAEDLLMFGNALATLVEDENLVNELMTTAVKDVSNVKYFRALLFLSTFLVGGFLFYRYLCSESVLQEATGTRTADGSGRDKRRLQQRMATDRRFAASLLVRDFYQQVTGEPQDDPNLFPDGIQLVDNLQENEIWREMKKTGRRLRRKSHRWWTTSRLGELKSQLDYWRHLYENNKLICVTNIEDDQPNNSLPG